MYGDWNLGQHCLRWYLLPDGFHCWQLRWYDHVQWATSCIKSITNFQIPGTRKKGSPQRTWSECVKTDVNECGLAVVDPADRDACTAGVWHLAWCCQPHQMGHGQHLNLKWIWFMDGCMDRWMNEMLTIISEVLWHSSEGQFHRKSSSFLSRIWVWKITTLIIQPDLPGVNELTQYKRPFNLTVVFFNFQES